MLNVFEFTEAVKLVILEVAVLKLLVKLVMLFVAELTFPDNDVIELVFVVILVSKPPMVFELTPPILFTVGKSAVPPKSFVNLSFPFTVALASATEAFVTKFATNAVVAI